MANSDFVIINSLESKGNARVSVLPAKDNTGRNDRTIILTWKSANVQDVVRTIKHAGKPEFVEYDNDSAYSEKLGQIVTIVGTSNSNKLTFSLGSGDLDNISLPDTYIANSISTQNGALIDGDPGASASFDFSIDIEVPANKEVYVRRREIIVTDAAGNQHVCIIAIEKGDAFIYISQNNIELSAEGSPVSIQVDSNTNWFVE